MLLLLVLCLCITSSAQSPDHTGIWTVYAEGNISVPCGSYSGSPASLILKVQMEEYSNDSWVVVGMTPIILMVDTFGPSLITSKDNNSSSNYSCSADNTTSHTFLIDFKGILALKNISASVSEGKEWVGCQASKNWTLLQWYRDGEKIAVVRRPKTLLNVMGVRDESSFYYTSIIVGDTPVIKMLNITCEWLHDNATGWQRFVKEKYWIIVVVALSSALLCVMLMGSFVSMKRRRRLRRQAKSRFLKVSTAARNLYTDSNSPVTDVAHKDQDLTYQNVSVPLSKVAGDDCYSDKSSYLSMGGDSYLEPTTEGGDEVSDGGCYENPTPDQDDQNDCGGSLDGDCYENINEEIRDGSEGSQSYEDMKGSIPIQTKTEAPPDEGITQDEDADSYENMQTPLYTQPNRFFDPSHKSTEDRSEGRRASLVEPRTPQSPWKMSTELQ